MSAAKRKDGRACPTCGAVHSADADLCWLCLGPVENEVVRPPNRFESQSQSPYQFGLSTVMLLISLSAVLLGVCSMHPGLGLALTFVAIPALARTCIMSMRRKREGIPMSDMAKVGVFGGSLFLVIGVTTLLVLASAVALFLVCMGVMSFG